MNMMMMMMMMMMSYIKTVCSEFLSTIELKSEPRNRPGVAQRVPGGLSSQISITFGT